MIDVKRLSALTVGLCLLVAPSVLRAEPTGDAKGLLDEAIAELRENHVNRESVDWAALEKAAYATAGDAEQAQDAYPAIRQVIAALGEKHTMFYPARRPQPASTAPAAVPAPRPQPRQPEVKRLAADVGLVVMPGWPFARDNPTSEAWVSDTRAALAQADADGVCGWVVDVRDNGGGNVWPMLDVLGPLLGSSPFGTFVAKTRDPIIFSDGRASYPGMRPEMAPLPVLRLKSADAPVAVLMNGQTGSSAETVVTTFKGRPHTRFFGSPTANYVSTNNPKTLKDGSVITTTVGYTEDRTGVAYKGAIQPDVQVDDAGALDAATAWVRENGCGRSR